MNKYAQGWINMQWGDACQEEKWPMEQAKKTGRDVSRPEFRTDPSTNYRAVSLWIVELATSIVSTFGVPSITLASSLTTSL
jgi:hypothetical protein